MNGMGNDLEKESMMERSRSREKNKSELRLASLCFKLIGTLQAHTRNMYKVSASGIGKYKVRISWSNKTHLPSKNRDHFRNQISSYGLGYAKHTKGKLPLIWCFNSHRVP